MTWRRRKPSNREKENQRLLHVIHQVHQQSRGTYGSPRVHQALLQQGYQIGKKRVEQLMKSHQLQGRVVKVTYRHPGLKRFNASGKNLRLNQPEATAINQIWVGDVTYLKVKHRWHYLAVVMDIHSRRILGWSLKRNRTTDITISALKLALRNRHTGRITNLSY